MPWSFSLFVVAALLVIGLTGCATHPPGQDTDRSATRPYAGPRASANRSAKGAWPAVPFSPDPNGDGLVSVLQQEYMADRMDSVWVETAGGMVAAGFVDRGDDPPQTVYVFEALKGNYRDLPGYGPISSGVLIGQADLDNLRVVKLAAPVRFLRSADGNLTPGFFDPGHRVFFRWRDEVRPPEAERFDFSPEYDPVSSVLHPSRVLTTVDIDLPADETTSTKAPDP